MRRVRAGLLSAVVAICLATPASTLAQADLSLTFSGGPNGSNCPGSGPCGGSLPIAPGGQALFGLIVSNNGPGAASGIIVTVTFPPDVVINTPTSISPLTGSSSVVGGNPTLTCVQAGMVSGGSSTVAVVMNLDPDYPWENGLSAAASVAATSVDPVSSNNTASSISS
jgi:trimeric autotransporter adhesin